MPTIKSLWASIQGDPVFMRRVNGWMTIFWIVMIPLSIVFGLLSSVTYVSALSLWALVSGHWSAWQAARVEVEQVAEAHEREAEPGRGPRGRKDHRAEREISPSKLDASPPSVLCDGAGLVIIAAWFSKRESSASSGGRTSSPASSPAPSSSWSTPLRIRWC